MKILLAEDRQTTREILTNALVAAGHEVFAVADGQRLAEALSANVPDVLIAEVDLPGSEHEVLRQAIPRRTRRVIFLVPAGRPEVLKSNPEPDRIRYVMQPFESSDILKQLSLPADAGSAPAGTLFPNPPSGDGGPMTDTLSLGGKSAARWTFGEMVSESDSMRDVFSMARTLADHTAGVLIVGETGSGKSLLAQTMHARSRRAQRPLVRLSASSLPERDLEETLFGRMVSSGSGGPRVQEGRIEAANGGTLLFDDLDDFPASIQLKILDLVQTRSFHRPGSADLIRVDARFIAATKVAPEKLLQQGRLREDLYFSLVEVEISLPPLRERQLDIGVLLARFVERHGGGGTYDLDAETIDALKRYHWPGNVRELEGSVRRALALAASTQKLTRDMLLPNLTEASKLIPPESMQSVVERAEQDHIKRTLARTGGNRGEAAKILGISRKNLWEKMKEYGLE